MSDTTEPFQHPGAFSMNTAVRDTLSVRESLHDELAVRLRDVLRVTDVDALRVWLSEGLSDADVDAVSDGERDGAGVAVAEGDALSL